MLTKKIYHMESPGAILFSTFGAVRAVVVIGDKTEGRPKAAYLNFANLTRYFVVWMGVLRKALFLYPLRANPCSTL